MTFCWSLAADLVTPGGSRRSRFRCVSSSTLVPWFVLGSWMANHLLMLPNVRLLSLTLISVTVSHLYLIDKYLDLNLEIGHRATRGHRSCLMALLIWSLLSGSIDLISLFIMSHILRLPRPDIIQKGLLLEYSILIWLLISAKSFSSTFLYYLLLSDLLIELKLLFWWRLFADL